MSQPPEKFSPKWWLGPLEKESILEYKYFVPRCKAMEVIAEEYGISPDTIEAKIAEIIFPPALRKKGAGWFD